MTDRIDMSALGNGCLMVCLCDDDHATPIAGGAGMEMCNKHNAARLRSLLNVGWNVQLHVIDADGDIVPVTTAMVKEVV